MTQAYTTFEKVKGQRRRVDCPDYVDDATLNLTPNAIKVLEKRYVRRDADGTALETPAGMFYRVAAHVASAGSPFMTTDELSEKFYRLMTEKRFYPNSPTFTGAATPLGGLAACFVLPVADDLGKDSDGIFSTLRVAALIQQTGGGNGFSFGDLRPKGDTIQATAAISTGPVGFMRVYDAAFGEVAQGFSRRGANMAVLPCWHPDVEEFIECKAEEGRLTNFNVSVALTDEFMRQAQTDGDFDLINPRDGKVWKTVKAKALFDKIIKYAYRNGEPGALFIDAANRSNPVPHLYELKATNPCVTGDTLVATPEGERRVDSIEVGDTIYTTEGEGQVDRIEIYAHRPVFEVSFSNGTSIRATMAHQFFVPVSGLTGSRPVKLESLKVGAKVCTDGRRSKGSANYHYPSTQIVSIQFDSFATVYDLHEPISDTWITNGIVSRGCGEQWLGPYENCCLGSINLAVHVKDNQVDWELLAQSISEATHFLDNVVTVNAYVPSVPEIAEAAFRARRIGLGIMGLGDMMYKLGIRYGSEEGQEFAAQIMEFVRFHAMLKSIELAKELGSFEAFPGSIYDKKQNGGMAWKTPKPLVDYVTGWDRPLLDWKAIEAMIGVHGIRNAAQTTIAPTGTIATVCGCEGYGCEPVFALGYTRHFKDGDKDVELTYTSPLFEQALMRSTFVSADGVISALEHVAQTGECQTLVYLPGKIRNTFVVSSDITAEEHVRMQAAMQAFVDNSISKTCGLPEGATEEDVAKAYMLAWELGCKGLTVYVTGSREQVVLETKVTQDKKTAPATPQTYTVNDPPTPLHRPRPAFLQGVTYRKETPLGHTYVTVNSDEHKEPFEVFLNVGKAGSETAAVSEAIGRLMSLILRMPSSVTPEARLTWIADELSGIGGGRAIGFGPNRVKSLPDGIAQVLAEHLNGSYHDRREMGTNKVDDIGYAPVVRTIGDICPECGEATLLNVEGCRKCQSCGYSEC